MSYIYGGIVSIIVSIITSLATYYFKRAIILKDLRKQDLEKYYDSLAELKTRLISTSVKKFKDASFTNEIYLICNNFLTLYNYNIGLSDYKIPNTIMREFESFLKTYSEFRANSMGSHSIMIRVDLIKIFDDLISALIIDINSIKRK